MSVCGWNVKQGYRSKKVIEEVWCLIHQRFENKGRTPYYNWYGESLAQGLSC